ncbi:hypothetical protein [Cytobacillus horneckiae]|uniref:hypothetical protein n=1 Tax=Cytobacillus horneckiae TaxID=549687 RepID=UPI00203C3650|nr:hypothetical protein [Cytobacillus horneckiae]MCM3179026.1 hypothetical protein [Cytobacillus horneckiae]
MKNFIKSAAPYLFVVAIFFIILGAGQTETLSEDEKRKIDTQLLKVDIEKVQE